ncbi:MAG TPA: DUF262 domain-containing protein [Kofleriaceae bacterium]
MKRIYKRAFRLSRLAAMIESGIFAVPQLQREFVWNAAKACQLLDSVFNNYPIGTILVWKTEGRNEGLLRKTLHILPPYDPKNRKVYFLVDGQQRLSVLWNLLRGEGTRVTNADGKVVDFSNIYFNTEPTDEPRFIYRNALKGELADRVISVVALLSTKWRRRIKGFGKRAKARIEDCRRRILSYAAFLVFFDTNDVDEVREAFIRINSLGMRISSADRAFARASSVDLRNDVLDALHRLQNGFGTISRETILQTIAFALGERDLGDRAIERVVRRLEREPDAHAEFTRIWPRLREAFALAADYFVHDLGVPDVEFLPSEPMMTILSLYFFHRKTRPPPQAQATLRRWFWATAVGARYTGRGYRPNIVADVKLMRDLAEKPGKHFRPALAIQPIVLRQTDYRRSGPLSNAFFILLRDRGPRYLEDATPIPLGEISSRRNRSDKHHVFPLGYLKRSGGDEDRFHSILNICYLVARENQSIGKRAPATYLDDVPRSEAVRKKAMRSHLIPDEDSHGVWNYSVHGGFREFLEQRTWMLIRAFEQEAGMRLFERPHKPSRRR